MEFTRINFGPSSRALTGDNKKKKIEVAFLMDYKKNLYLALVAMSRAAFEELYTIPNGMVPAKMKIKSCEFCCEKHFSLQTSTYQQLMRC